MIPRSSALRTMLLLASVAASAAGCGLEKAWIYFPGREITHNPSDIGLAFEEVAFDTRDGVRINAWFIPAPDSRSALLWLHGNAGNLSNRVVPLGAFNRNLKRNILMIDYRQYGESGGKISEEGTYRDAEAAFDYLSERPEIDPRRIVVFGKSLGAAVAVELATRRRFEGLILEGPFTSIRDMAWEKAPWFPIGWTFRTRYDSLSRIKRIDVPLLVLHGDRDEVVPHEMGKRLFDAAPEPKTFYTITGAGHNNTIEAGGEPYFAEIRKFLDALPDR